MRYQNNSIIMARIPNVGKNVEQLKFPYTTGGSVTSETTLKKVFGIFLKLEVYAFQLLLSI